MERLRYVARAGGGDPAVIVEETVEALLSLAPSPGELVPLCRNLVERNITCAPLWWLCAHLLAEPDALARAWDLAEQIVCDDTAGQLAVALDDGATAMTIGHPLIAGAGLARRGDVSVLAVEAGHATHALTRRLDRGDIASVLVPAEGAHAAAAEADVIVIEIDAMHGGVMLGQMGTGLLAVAARSVGTPVWAVAGRGRRLPRPYVDAIVRRVACSGHPWEADVELVPREAVSLVIGPDGASDPDDAQPIVECPLVPELIPA